MRLRIPLLLILPLGFCGCFTTQTEKIEIRRTEAELARAREAASETRETVRERLFQANLKRRLSRELFASETERQEELKKLRAVLAQVPDDPWTAYEQDRRDTFYRKWAGVREPLPPLVGEASGPPGWIGPKLPGVVEGGPAPVEGLSEEEASGAEGGDEEEGGYGDEEEGDYGDDY
ncbi:MAG: hypothetical protein KDD82_03820 [Planctomycetes bacterium]|nr:hypothetical protein [Planctomycetota bacterium]